MRGEFLQYEQTGFFAKWQQEFFPQDNECTRPSPRGPRSLGLDDLVGCFTLLGTLLTLATIVFVVELLVNNTTLCFSFPLTFLPNPALRRPCSQEKRVEMPRKRACMFNDAFREKKRECTNPALKTSVFTGRKKNRSVTSKSLFIH
nr:uncharacterized protein LOC113821179 [Penaeus vannamei]